MSRSIDFNGIKVTATAIGDGRGFFYANSKNRDELEIVAALTEQLPEVKEARVEWVDPLELVRSDGTSRVTGGYWKMIASF